MVEIDKNIGNWITDEDDRYTLKVSYIDDLAYHIYCQYRKNRIKENISTQVSFMIHPKVYWRFYNEARLLIRKEKINKIKRKHNDT
jgi:hypothetical protein